MDLRWIWPRISDETSARRAIKDALWAYILFVVATTAVAVYTLTTHQKIGGYYDAWVLVDAALVAFIAWRVWRNSRIWAVIGLTLMVIEDLDKLSNTPSTFGIGTILLLLGIFNATRGTFALHKYHANRSPGEKLSIQR